MQPSGAGASDTVAVLVGRVALIAAAFTPLIVVPSVFLPSTVPPAVFFRLSVLVALCALVWGGTTGTVRLTDRRDPIALSFGVFLCTAALAAFLGEAPLRSLYGDLERMGGVVFGAYLFGFYLAARALFDERWWRRFLFATGTTAVVVGFWTAAPYFASLWTGSEPIGFPPRTSGPLANPGYLAIYLLMAGAAACLYADLSGRWRLLLAALPFLLWGFLAAQSLAAFLGLFAGLGAGAVTLAVRDRERVTGEKASFHVDRRIAWGAAGAVLLLLLAEAARGAPLFRKLAGIRTEENAVYRADFWRSGLRSVADAPIFGLGPENFALAFARHYDGSIERIPLTYVDRAHNLLVEVIATTGMVGAIAFLVLCAAVVRELLLMRRSSLVTPIGQAILVAAAVAWIVYQLAWFPDLASSIPLVALLGYVRFRRCGAGVRIEATARARRGGALPAAAAVAILALFTFQHSLAVLRGGHILHRALDAPTVEERIEGLSRATALRLPEMGAIGALYARYLLDFAPQAGALRRAPERLDLIAMAVEDADAALDWTVAVEPSAEHHRVVRGDLLRFGAVLTTNPTMLSASMDSYTRADSLNPERLLALYRMADLYQLLNRPDRAHRVLDEADRRYPGDGLTAAIRAGVLLREGRDEEAAAALRAAWQDDYLETEAETLHLLRILEEEGRWGEASALLRDYFAIGWGYPDEPLPDFPEEITEPADREIALKLPTYLLRDGKVRESVEAAMWIADRMPDTSPLMRRYAADVSLGWEGPWARYNSFERAIGALAEGPPLLLDPER